MSVNKLLHWIYGTIFLLLILDNECNIFLNEICVNCNSRSAKFPNGKILAYAQSKLPSPNRNNKNNSGNNNEFLDRESHSAIIATGREDSLHDFSISKTGSAVSVIAHNIVSFVVNSIHQVHSIILHWLRSFKNIIFRSSSSSTISSNTKTTSTAATLSSAKRDGQSSQTLSPSVSATHWAGKAITIKEHQQIDNVRQELKSLQSKFKSKWGRHIHDVEILRFLRAKHSNVASTVKALLAHDAWRISEFGPEAKFAQESFPADSFGHTSPLVSGPPIVDETLGSVQISPLRYEGFWVGVDTEDCPTLVLRTQVHDGIYYNDDPRIYTAFMAKLIEEGRTKYGVGIDKQMCIVMDRAGQVFRNTEKKKEKLDMAVIPALLELFRHLYSTINDQYPDLLHRARIAPASWFFSMCYRITSTVMAPQHRERFLMLKDKDLSSKLHPYIPPERLPKHLGGYDSTAYRSDIYIKFDPAKSLFPIDGSYKKKNRSSASSNQTPSSTSAIAISPTASDTDFQ